jgi:hypothetical protein
LSGKGKKPMRKMIVMMFASALFASTLSAQKIAFDVDTRELSAKAIETVEVTLRTSCRVLCKYAR